MVKGKRLQSYFSDAVFISEKKTTNLSSNVVVIIKNINFPADASLHRFVLESEPSMCLEDSFFVSSQIHLLKQVKFEC